MLETAKKMVTSNKQPIKAICQQDLHALSTTLEKLQAWEDTLQIINSFFSQPENEPLNKKVLVRKFHAQSKVFSVFQEDFNSQTTRLANQIEELRQRETIKRPIDPLE